MTRGCDSWKSGPGRSIILYTLNTYETVGASWLSFPVPPQHSQIARTLVNKSISRRSILDLQLPMSSLEDCNLVVIEEDFP